MTSGDLSTLDDWISVLAVATRYAFDAYRALAMANVAPLASAARRVRLARTYAITEWLVPAYLELCTRRDPLTIQDGEELGMRDVILISEIRHIVRNAPPVAVSERAVLLQINGKLM